MAIIDSSHRGAGLAPEHLLSLLSLLTWDGSPHSTRAKLQSERLDFEEFLIDKLYHQGGQRRGPFVSYKFLMLKPIILRLLSKLADAFFPLASEVIRAEAI